jgi:selenide,water dikinase
VRIDAQRAPVIAEALELANMGLIPAGAYKNRDFRHEMIIVAETVSRGLVDIFFDPQTSGGLLIAVARHQADDFAAALVEAGMPRAAIVGDVIDTADEKIWVA